MGANIPARTITRSIEEPIFNVADQRSISRRNAPGAVEKIASADTGYFLSTRRSTSM